VSENIERLGYFAREFTEGRVLYREIVHPEDRDRVREEIGRYAEQNVEEYTQRYRIITRDGDARWVEDQTTVVRDRHGNKLYNQGIIYDITERKQAEDRLKKSEEKFRRIIETTGEGFLMMDDQLRITQVNDAYCHMLGYSREELIGNSPLQLATPEFRQFMESHRDRLLAAEQRRMEGRLMAKDGHIVPVLIHGNTLRDSRGRKLGHISFISDLTYQKKALELAGRVQRSLAPQSAPTIPGLDIFGRSDACQEVGGDYYDFFFSSQDTPGGLKVVVGDISGHGVDAALHMTAARTLFRTRVVQPGTPTQIVSAMNRQLASDMAGTGHFMTLFYMEIDPVRRTADWIRAGHDPALVYLPGEDRFVELRGKGLPLGIEAGTDYPSRAFADLVPGAVIALGTDGIWEAANAEGAFFGRDRFQQILRDSAAGTARDIVQTVFDAVSDFTGGLPQEDDITLVVVKVVPEGPDVVI
jgi:sigma-B regulation protein RsbU (phosphoserine phosphatase)